MAVTAEHLIIVGRGRLIRDVSVEDFVREFSSLVVRVRSPQAQDLRAALRDRAERIDTDEPDALEIEGLQPGEIGEAASRGGYVLHELAPQQVSLEEAFMELTAGDVEYRAQIAAGRVARDAEPVS
jgi:ABC-2 type transport system ATP-binding protein